MFKRIISLLMALLNIVPVAEEDKINGLVVTGMSMDSSVTGIPYCWGDARGNVAACGLPSFSTSLSRGYTAGNVKGDRSWGYQSGTAGVDSHVLYQLRTD